MIHAPIFEKEEQIAKFVIASECTSSAAISPQA
jgi:hypothetical protein